MKLRSLKTALLVVFLLPATAQAQGKLADYDRANNLRKTFQDGGPYGDRLRYDFFVHHLLGVEPPDWNTVEENKAAGN